MSISSKVMMPLPLRTGTLRSGSSPLSIDENSFNSNCGTVMMPMGAFGTAGIFLPSLYFSIIFLSSQNLGVASPHSLMGAS